MSTQAQGAAVSSPPANGTSGGWAAAHSNSELQFFNPYAVTQQTENRLPHWQQNGAVYFVTFRLADALPKKLLRDWQYDREIWFNVHPQPWTSDVELEYHKRFSGKIEQWLDAGHGSCILKRPDCAAIVEETIGHFEGERLCRLSSVVMPNHVHVLFVQNPECSLEKLLRSWKSYTSRQINSVMDRLGSIWQRDYFDRIVRDEQHFANCVRYIRRNPERAALPPGMYILYEADLAKRID